MPRDLPLSNGKLLVLFDREYRITDLYFPHVGKENHAAGNVFRLGVWVDGASSPRRVVIRLGVDHCR